MTFKVKIFGAGSIGNHLAHASRSLNWEVDICDTDKNALYRTKNKIYPKRYGKWDNSIGLYKNDQIPKNKYDIIIIGTPPKHHIKILLESLKEKTKAILIEKPLCTPNNKYLNKVVKVIKKRKIHVFIGYNHILSNSINKILNIFSCKSLGKIQTIDVEFREHWKGIFDAHPWLAGPQDTYLGNIKEGGGALLEHSHALNLWQYLAFKSGFGKIKEVQALMDIYKGRKLYFDKISLLNLKANKGLIGRVIQDVVTLPPKKYAKIQGTKGFVEWYCNYNNTNSDMILLNIINKNQKKYFFPKTRPDDFINELKHIEKIIKNKKIDNPTSIKSGIETMVVIQNAIKSNKLKKTIKIYYDKYI